VTRWLVGPVLQAGPRADAVVAAILALNEGVQIVDRGAYVRVLAPGVCRVTRSAVEAESGGPFVLPGDLERIMPSFQGRLRVDDTSAVWWGGGEREAPP
jgi:hypothetical protein